MGFQGKLRDLSLVDILQVVQMTQKTGTLRVLDEGAQILIHFRSGNIIDAVPIGGARLTDFLERKKLIPEGAAARAAEEQARIPGQERIGETLVRLGFITEEKLREGLVARVEAAIYDALAWVKGEFDFDIGDGKPDVETVVEFEDILPGVNINTQQVLMEALRIFDERSQGRLPDPEEEKAPTEPVPDGGPRLFLVGSSEFRGSVRFALRGLGTDVQEFDDASLARDALSEVGEGGVLVVLHLEREGTASFEVPSLLLNATRVGVLTAGGEPGMVTEAIGAGAIAHVGILPDDPGPALSYLQSLVSTQLEGLRSGTERKPSSTKPQRIEVLSGQINQLGERLESLASEVQTSSVTLKILEFVAERLDRGVLFLVRKTDLQGLGAFGSTEEGDPIGPLASGLRLPIVPDSTWARMIERRESTICELSDGEADQLLYGLVGAPKPRDVLLLPLVSVGNVVAVIYADNGFTGKPIEDYAPLEVLARQAGLALENSLLRRMLQKNKQEG